MRYLIRDLAPGKTYVIQFRSKAADGSVSEWSNAYTVTTANDTVAPNTPTGLAVVPAGNSFQASWNAVTTSTDGSNANDLKAYLVKVESSAAPGVSRIYTTPDTKFELTFEKNAEIFTSAKASITMSVASIDTSGNTSAYSSTVTATNAAPSNPTGLSVTAAVDSINVKWTGVSDADLAGYRIYSGTTAGSQTTLEWTGNATNVALNSFSYSTPKWYKVAAFDVFGTESTTPPVAGPVTPNSSASVDTTAPDVPAGLAAVITTSANAANTSAAVSWTAVADPTNDLAGYMIGYRPAGASDWQYVTVDYTNTSTIIDRLRAYVNYEFRIRSYDFSANYSAWSSTVTATGATNAAPATPSAPTVAGNTMQIQVSHDNTKAAGGAMDADVAYYEVYASSTSGFTPASSNMVGQISVGPAMVATFPFPSANASGAVQTAYVKVIAVDNGGLKSSASAQATATTNLISTVNIGDAVITNAKVNDLAANKITAGTGFVNDLTVKSKFTLGDASTDGIIESYDYGTSAGVTGFRLAKSGLIIKTGAIEAAALKIQQGQNIAPYQYASFEATSAFYNSEFTKEYVFLGVDTTFKVFGSQSLAQSWAVSATPGTRSKVYFAPTSTTYNQAVDPSTSYIVSIYVRPDAVRQINLFVKDSTGAITNVATATPPANTTTRISGVYTTGASVTSVVVGVDSDATVGTVGNIVTTKFDGYQFEQKWSALTTPSSWSPPGVTSIVGPTIRTGEIRSNNNILVGGVSQPNWSINLDGNAQLGDVVVRGKIIVGSSTDDYVNIAPSSGNFETNVTGYTAISTAASSVAIARTTTGGEVLAGTGSAKVTAAAGSKSMLGLTFTTTRNIIGRANVTVSGLVRTDAAGGYMEVALYNTVGTLISTSRIVDSAIANDTYSFSAEMVVPAGETINTVQVYQAGTITTTALLFDSIVVNADDQVGPSLVASQNYVKGSVGWRIQSNGNVEFNNGVFRGTLGAGIVNAENIAGDLILANKFRSVNGTREASMSPDGIRLQDGSNILVDLPTDTSKGPFFSGDMTATSLTIVDQFAMRGSVNELSKGSTLTVSSGTTAPTSPPAVSVGWETFDMDFDPAFVPYRYGLAYANGYIWTMQDIWGSSPKAWRYYPDTKYYSINGGLEFTGMRSAFGGIAAIGNNIYSLGYDADGNVVVEGRSTVDGSRIFLVTYTAPVANYGLAIGADTIGNQLLIGFVRQANNLLYFQSMNATTGATGAVTATDFLLSGGDKQVSYIGQSNYDFGTAKLGVAFRGRTGMFFVNPGSPTYLRPTSGNEIDFSSGGNVYGAMYADIDGNGARFYTFDAPGSKLTRHSDLSWAGTSASNYTFWAASTWYDPNITGGTHETTMSPLKKFTFGTKRQSMTLNTPPLPVRPTPNTTDDVVSAGVYLARGSATPTRTQMERQAYTPDGTTTMTFQQIGGLSINVPAAGGTSTNPPPSTNGFASATEAPGLIRSSNDTFNLFGDGSGKWGDISFTLAGAVTLAKTPIAANMRQVTVGTGSGGTATIGATAAAVASPQDVSGTFTAPASGSVIVTVNGVIRSNVAGNYVAVGFEIRSGTTIGAGSVAYAFSLTDSALNYGTAFSSAHREVVVTGLTPGASYNIRAMGQAAAAGTNNNVSLLRITVQEST